MTEVLDFDRPADWFDEELHRPETDDSRSSHRSRRVPELDTICLSDFAELDLPTRKTILHPILPERSLGMLFAGRGIGKTHVALGIGYAVSTGGEFLRWHAKAPRNVLYVDGEMPQEMLQDRLLKHMAASSVVPEQDAFRLLCMDRQELGMSINLSVSDDQKAIEAELRDTDFLILDNMSTLTNGGAENDAESWNAMQEWLLQLRRRGITVLIVHHAGRSGNARGTSKREDVLDTIVQLKRPSDYLPSDGARFEVHLTKARGLFGDDVEPFEAKLTVTEENEAIWECCEVGEEDSELKEEVMERSKAGKSIRVIASELQVKKGKVERILKRARQSAA
ncbi:MAG: hypothetical protein A4S14_17100 [Proteobacteria bacterium SG_bin9]|nr:MAG: hypothetical protein A4S14_17100 [Proteobacteria bacterium SG_bin9]